VPPLPKSPKCGGGGGEKNRAGLVFYEFFQEKKKGPKPHKTWVGVGVWGGFGGWGTTMLFWEQPPPNPLTNAPPINRPCEVQTPKKSKKKVGKKTYKGGLWFWGKKYNSREKTGNPPGK